MPTVVERLRVEMNKQIQEEVFSASLYYQMAGWFENQNLSGFAMWLKVQALEEEVHAHLFFKHLADRRAEIEILDIPRPQVTWKTPKEAFEAAYNHEVHISERINFLVKIAREENDYAADTGILQWFVNEQIEEEQQTDVIVQKLDMIGDDKAALYVLDKDLGLRVFVAPTGFVL